MSPSPKSQEQLGRAVLLLLLGCAVFFVVWTAFLEPWFTPKIEVALGKKIWELSEPLSFLYHFVFGLLPPIALGVGAYAYAYHKWFMPSRTRLANEQLQKMADARQAMATAITYIEMFEQELQQKSADADRLKAELRSLTLLNAENAKELEGKLKAMESLTGNRIWFERIVAFFIGVFSSLAASYLWQVMQQ